MYMISVFLEELRGDRWIPVSSWDSLVCAVLNNKKRPFEGGGPIPKDVLCPFSFTHELWQAGAYKYIYLYMHTCIQAQAHPWRNSLIFTRMSFLFSKRGNNIIEKISQFYTFVDKSPDQDIISELQACHWTVVFEGIRDIL